MDIKVSHSLSKTEALNKIKNLIGSLKKKYGSEIKNVEETWTDSKGEINATIKGFNINAILNVNDKSLSVKGNIPFLLKPVSGKIENIIIKNLEEVLN